MINQLTNHDLTPDGVIKRAVAVGDRRRRWVEAVNAVVRQSPLAAAVLVASIVLTRVAGGSAAVFFVFFAATLVYLAVTALRAAWPARGVDITAERLDRDAHLDGALRSAHWFATHPAGTPWIAFHVSAAADRLRDVDWRGVYAAAPSGRRMAAAVAGIALAIAVAAWPDGESIIRARSRTDLALNSSAARPKEIGEVLKALSAQGVAPEEARAVVEKMLKDPNLDPALRKQIEKMLGEQEMGKGQSDQSSAGEQDKEAMGGKDAEGSPPESDDLKWAESETASREANEGAHRGSPPPNENPSKETPKSEKGGKPSPGAKPNDSRQQRERSPGSAAGLSLGDEADEANSGGQNGEGLSSSGGGKTANVRLDVMARETATALSREVIRAIEASEGKNIKVEEAHRTEARRSSLGFGGVEGLTTYDRAPSDASQVVPETRRALLERYFVREAQ